MKKKNNSMVIVLVLVILLTSILAGCAQSAQAPTEDDSTKPIKMGWLTDLTGPLASSCIPQMESGQDYLDYLNANGGVLGHPLEYSIVDTKYDNNVAVAGFEKMATQDKVLSVGVISATFMSTCKPLAERYKIPLTGPSEYGVLLPVSTNQYVFGGGPAFADLYRSSLYWIKDTWKKPDPPRIAIMGLDIATAKSTLKGVKWMLDKELKWPIVATEWMSISATNATSQVTNLKNAKPDYVILCSAGTPSIIFFKTAKAMGLSDSTIILDTYLSSIPAFRAADRAAMTGVINHIPVALYPQMADEVPILKTIAEINKKKRFATPLDWVRISSVASLIGVVDILEIAIKKYGFSNLTGEKIKLVMENDMAGTTSLGLSAPNETSPTNHITGHDCIIARTTETYDVEILYKWYHMPPWPSIAGDPDFWAP